MQKVQAVASLASNSFDFIPNPCTILSMGASIQLGARVYLKNAICGFPGCVVGWDRKGNAIVFWDDLDLGRNTSHSVDSLVVDEAFVVHQLALFGEEAA